MQTKKTFLSLLLLTALVSCAHVKIPDTEVCAVAGIMAAGMNCATTQSAKTREMNLDETLNFLEAQEAVVDVNGRVIKEARSAAICQTSKDYVSLKTALEQACRIMKKRCSYEIKEMIESLGNAIDLVASPETRQSFNEESIEGLDELAQFDNDEFFSDIE